MDQELADAAAYAIVVHSPDGSIFQCEMTCGCHLEIMILYQKSDFINRCTFALRTFLSNFILIRFETTKP